MLTFNKKYFLLFITLLVSEILIAKYANGFIRHTFGDFLVVLLLYCLVKSIIKIKPNSAAILTLLISFGIEFLQLTDLQNHFPEDYSYLMKLVLGTTFRTGDLVAYFFGFLTIITIENNLKYWYESK